MTPEFDPTAMTRDGCFLVDESGKRYLDLATSEIESDAGDRRPEYGERLQRAFADECAANDVRGRLSGGPTAWTIEFDGQENASPELMLGAFLDELREAGVACAGQLALHPAMSEVDADQAVDTIRHCVRRIRTLLVEHNSWLSGGLRYPFPESLPGVAQRGLAIYRFPKTGNVDVSAIDDRIRIEFASGELGPVMSSGFYLPTLFDGDFTVEADYQLHGWRPDTVEPACFALFAQNEDSSRRYYAQRMSAGDEPHRLVASMSDVLSESIGVKGDQGSFRITRRGDEMTCYHAQDGVWTDLGSASAPPEREMLLGAKIWTKIRCQGLTADIYNLRIEGRMADRQVSPVPVAKDPRSNPPTHP